MQLKAGLGDRPSMPRKDGKELLMDCLQLESWHYQSGTALNSLDTQILITLLDLFVGDRHCKWPLWQASRHFGTKRRLADPDLHPATKMSKLNFV